MLSVGLNLWYYGEMGGDAPQWYESDALFAWDSITDLDNTQVDPILGGSLALVTGPGATIAGGLWDMDSTVYFSSTAMTANIDRTKPILVAHVLDEDNHITNFVNVFVVGGTFYARLTLSGSNQPRYDWFGTASAGVRCEEAAMTPGKKVYWTYFDPAASQIRAGINQTENTTGGPVAFAPTTGTGADIRIGSSDATARSLMKHGSLQVVNRTGLTLVESLAIVQKMQTLHGI